MHFCLATEALPLKPCHLNSIRGIRAMAVSEPVSVTLMHVVNILSAKPPGFGGFGRGILVRQSACAIPLGTSVWVYSPAKRGHFLSPTRRYGILMG